MKYITLFTLVLFFNALNAQSYKNGDATLNIFTINDSLKYFEFYTPEFPHGDVECGILLRAAPNTYSLKYADESNYKPFNLICQGDSFSVLSTSKKGYLPYHLKGLFVVVSDSVQQSVSSFYLNYPVFHKAKKKAIIKFYEYPSLEADSKSVSFKKGNTIEEKWSVGVYPSFTDYHPIKTKTWIAAVCGGKFIGWFLLSDVEAFFEKIEQ